MQQNALLCCAAFLVLALCGPVTVVAEGPAAQGLSESPNAERQARLHEEALAALLLDYQGTAKQALKRFEKLAEMRVDRYLVQLDSTVRTLTRQGAIDEASSVQAFRQEAQEWVVAPPDEAGQHFLSLVDFDAVKNTQAVKHKEELLKHVDQAAEAYRKQLARAFERYQEQVVAARWAYRGELEAVLKMEQRAGRLDAVKQVEAELDRLALKVQVPRPAQPDQNQDEVQALPDPAKLYHGYYQLQYFSADGRKEKSSFIIELTEDAGTVHAQRWPSDRSNWHPRTWRVDVLERDEERIVLEHQTKGVPARHHIIFQDGQPTDSRMWWSENLYREGEKPDVGKVEPLGSPGADLLGLKDGVYTVDLDTRLGPSGRPQSKRGQYRLEIKHGTVAVTGIKWSRLNADWGPMIPRVMFVETKDSGLLLRYDKKTTHVDHVIALDLSDEKAGELRVWWDSAAFERGDAPAAIGRMEKP